MFNKNIVYQSLTMKNILILERVLLFLFFWRWYLLSGLEIHISWRALLLLFFLPDVWILGYGINNKIWAFTYNLFHHIWVWIAVILIWYYLQNTFIQMSWYLLVSHSYFDRILWFWLKWSSFHETHLGKIWKKKL